jgi:hypothetical protein
MGEERNPFNGVNAVGVGAADEFMPAAGLPDELGVAELPDDLAAKALGNQIFKFHNLLTLREGGGHWRSMP